MFLIPDSLEIKVIPNTKMSTNRGVFAKKDIPGGMVIGDYLGKLIPHDEEDEQKFGTYYMTYSNDASVYGDPSKPGVHIMNHSCMPNCAMIEYDTHILYYTLRKIFKGEELTVRYDLGLPDESCSPCTHQCYCGTPLCTGTTHSSEHPIHSYVEPDDRHLKPGETLLPFKKYPKTIRDSMDDDIYASLKHKPLTVNDEKLPHLKLIRKLIRENGRYIQFKKIGVTVYGVQNKFILTKIK